MTIDPSQIRRICAVLEAQTESFAALTVLGELVPAHSFRVADLSGVDFGSDDLSEFDFIYANLRGANLSKTTGLHWSKLVNAQFDDTTSLPNDLRWLACKEWDDDAYWRLHDNGRYDEALEFCRRVRRYDPFDMSARVFEAHLLEAHLEKADEAIDLMMKAIKEDPVEPNFHFFLAQALKTKRRIDEAEQAYRKAASLTSGKNRAKILVAIAELVVEFRQGADRDHQMWGLLDEAFNTDRTDLDMVGTVFRVCRQSGDIKRVVTYAGEMLRQMSGTEVNEKWRETLCLLKPLIEAGYASELADALVGMETNSNLGMLRDALLAAAGGKLGADELDRAVDAIPEALGNAVQGHD